MKTAFQLRHNISILGPPGSGKGSYGRLLADVWKVPLITVSSVLRQHEASHPSLSADTMDAGALVDDDTVTRTLGKHLAENRFSAYILDGFPRTVKQVQLMQETWPTHHHVHSIFQLSVPDFVCQAKMLGRRKCSRCGREANIRHVSGDGFDLPAQRPACPDEASTACDPEVHWQSRNDDTEATVLHRLATYRHHEGSIVDSYHRDGRVVTFTPYNGYDDFPRMKETLKDYLLTHTSY